MTKSKIEWTEATWNPTTGCTKISKGCKNCYAEVMANRLQAMQLDKYRNGFELTMHYESLRMPYIWKKPKMIFVNSMSDLFHKDIPLEFIKKVFKAMNENQQHTFQVLTKRADKLEEYYTQLKWTPNIWIGVSVEDNNAYKERVDKLLMIKPAKVRFISFEPLLEEVTLNEKAIRNSETSLDWIIVGGESGNNRRPFNPDWARILREQAKKLGIKFFMKQIDKITPIPEDLMIREYPTYCQLTNNIIN